MTLYDIAVAFREAYATAAAEIGKPQGVKCGDSDLPSVETMMPAAKAVCDTGAEPHHYAWFVARVLTFASNDDEIKRLSSWQNLVKDESFNARSAQFFRTWWKTEAERRKLSVRISRQDFGTRIDASDAAAMLRWSLDDCQDPVLRADSILTAVRFLGRKCNDEEKELVRIGQQAARYQPGYDIEMFPQLVKSLGDATLLDMEKPKWIK